MYNLGSTEKAASWPVWTCSWFSLGAALLLQIKQTNKIYEPRHEKTNILVSDLVRHKPGCTDTEDG